MDIELYIATINLAGSIFFMIGTFQIIYIFPVMRNKIDFIYNKLKYEEVPPPYPD